jgi:hypothetical protein
MQVRDNIYKSPSLNFIFTFNPRDPLINGVVPALITNFLDSLVSPTTSPLERAAYQRSIEQTN